MKESPQVKKPVFQPLEVRVTEKQAKEVLAGLLGRLRTDEDLNPAEMARRIGAIEGALKICQALGLLPDYMLKQCANLGTELWTHAGGRFDPTGAFAWKGSRRRRK